jgi:TonB family protein
VSQPRSVRRASVPTGAYQGVLRDRGTGLARYLVHAGLLHGGLLAVLLVGWAGADEAPPNLRPDAFYVSAVVLPKAEGLPDKPTHVAKPDPGEQGTKPTPPAEPDRMLLKEEPEKKKGPEEPKKEPEKKKEEPKEPKKKSRSDLLASLGDPSDQDRFATDVDGDEDATPSSLDSRFGRKMSRYDRDIHDRSKERWRPDLALVNQVSDDVETIVTFTIEANGGITDIALAKGSGNYAFDMSCAAAVQRAGRMPPPPSAPWPVSILFRPEERR